MPKLQPVIVSILTALLIVACQGDSVNQASDKLADCRKIQHALGEVCVPQNPSRLVSLDDVTLANALALEIPSIGVSLDGEMPKYIANSEQITRLGKSEQPSLEKILQLKPDLIMGLEFWGESIFQQLSQIAPTALGNWDGYPSWREYFDFVANVLDREDEAKQVWDQYTQKVEAIQTALGNQLQNIEVSVVYACCGTITIDAENSFAGSILDDIGIRRPDNHAAVEGGIIILSEELIPEMDADVLFVAVYDEESEQILEDWQQKPLWNQLRAVQKGQVYVVDTGIWRGGNPIAADLMLDELFQDLIEDRA